MHIQHRILYKNNSHNNLRYKYPADYTLLHRYQCKRYTSQHCIKSSKKCKVCYGKEPPSGKSATRECGFNCQRLAVIYWSECGAPSCSRPQPAMDNGVRDGRSNWLVAPSILHRAVPPELHVLHSAMRAANHKTCCTQWVSNVRPTNNNNDSNSQIDHFGHYVYLGVMTCQIVSKYK